MRVFLLPVHLFIRLLLSGTDLKLGSDILAIKTKVFRKQGSDTGLVSGLTNAYHLRFMMLSQGLKVLL